MNDDYLRKICNYPHLLGHLVGRNKLTELHSDWIHHIWDSKNHTALQGHRGSYKTTAILVVGCIYWLLFNPDDRIAIIRKKFTDASEILTTISKLMKTEEIKTVFQYAHGIPPKAIIDRNDKITFNFKSTKTPEGNIDAFGIDTGITGKHYDKIICDDIVTLKDRISRAERDKTINILREVITNVIDPNKYVSHIGTPWHKQDAWSIPSMPEPKKYDVYSTNILSTQEIIEKKKLTTGSLFSANYELKHILSEESLFQTANFFEWEYGKSGVVGHIDAGFSGDHYTALTFMYKRAEDNKFGVIGWCFQENIKNKWDFIIDKYKKYYCGTLYIETNADKGFVADELRKRGCVVRDYHEKINKHIKITTHLKKFWDNLEFANETDNEYINQILDYIEGQEPDDCPDSLSSLIRNHFDKKDNSILWEY